MLPLVPFPCMDGRAGEAQKWKPPSVQLGYTLGTPWICLGTILSVLLQTVRLQGKGNRTFRRFSNGRSVFLEIQSSFTLIDIIDT